MIQTLMRLGCHECAYTVIAPNDPLDMIARNRLMSDHFADTGHHLFRPIAPDDLMQPYFVIEDAK